MTKTLPVALAAVLLVAGCASRDVRTDLQIVEVHSGWFDMGRVDANSGKIVPGISFRLKNVSMKAISGVEVNAVFRDVKDEAVIDEHYVKAISYDRPLEAGASSEPIVLRSRFGYTGTETRPQMFQNSGFVDKRVTILAKHRRNNWTPIGQFQIDRRSISR